ncbi:MAG: type VI secretion system baseplate subunit TssG [Sandaracinaceae bacterium]
MTAAAAPGTDRPGSRPVRASAPAPGRRPRPRPDASALPANAARVVAAAPGSSFFHLVSLLARLTPGATPVGADGTPADERIRFCHDPGLGFSAGDVAEVGAHVPPPAPEACPEPGAAAFEVVTTFLGLTGAASPLPLHLAEEVLHEDEDAPVRRRFLDLFHHRAISLLYRGVVTHSPARAHAAGPADPWMTRALYLAGLDPEVQGRGLGIDAPTLLRLAPLLAGRGGGARALTLALGEVLAEDLAPEGRVEVRQLQGGWTAIDDTQLLRLGPGGPRLGAGAILGRRVLDRSGRFAIRIGPVSVSRARRFGRDEELLLRVRRVVELCVREPLDFDVHVLLAPGASPGFVLREAGRGAALGRDARLPAASGGLEVIVVPGQAPDVPSRGGAGGGEQPP